MADKGIGDCTGYRTAADSCAVADTGNGLATDAARGGGAPDGNHLFPYLYMGRSRNFGSLYLERLVHRYAELADTDGGCHRTEYHQHPCFSLLRLRPPYEGGRCGFGNTHRPMGGLPFCLRSMPPNLWKEGGECGFVVSG